MKFNVCLYSNNCLLFSSAGECWSGVESGNTKYASDDPSAACIGRDQKSCLADDQVCVGEVGTNFVYEITGKIPRDIFVISPLYIAPHT